MTVEGDFTSLRVGYLINNLNTFLEYIIIVPQNEYVLALIFESVQI